MSCIFKRTYKREDVARRELKRMKKRVIDPFRLNVYRCEEHNGWHIGTRPFTVRPEEAVQVP